MRCNASQESLWMISNWESVADKKPTAELDPGSLEKCIDRKVLKLNRGKCQVLHLKGPTQELVETGELSSGM